MELIRSQFGTYFYQECKNPEQKKGSIIFIHGYATTSAYHDVFAGFIDQDYDYYALQLPGHGVEDYKAYTDKKIEVDFYTNYCVRLIKSLDLKKFFLIGHSMGGGLGIRVANSFNKDVLAYVAVTPMNSHLPVSTIFNFFAFAPNNEVKTAKLTNRVYKDFEKTIGKENIDQHISNEIEYQKRYHHFFVDLKKSMFSLKNWKICKNSEHHLKVPTLAIAGRFDRLIPYKSVLKTFKNKPNAKVIIFEESGHIPFQEEKELYAKTVLDFFEQYVPAYQINKIKAVKEKETQLLLLADHSSTNEANENQENKKELIIS